MEGSQKILLLPLLLLLPAVFGADTATFSAKESGDGKFILADANFAFSIPYKKQDGSNATNTGLKVPKDATVTAALDKGTHTLDIVWGKPDMNTTVSLGMGEKEGKLMVDSVALKTFQSPDFGFVGGDSSALNLNFDVHKAHPDFAWESSGGFQCDAETELKDGEAALTLKDFKVQISPNSSFGPDFARCAADAPKTTTTAKTTTPKPTTTTTIAPENTYKVPKDAPYCILLKAGIVIDITYKAMNKTGNTTNVITKKETVKVPHAGWTPSGSCNVSVANKSAEQELNISFDKSWELSFLVSDDKMYTGAANGASYTVYKALIRGSINDSTAIKQTFDLTNEVSEKGNGALNRFLLGSANKSVACGEYKHSFGELEKNNVTVELILSDVQFEAFAHSNGTFSSSEKCSNPAGSSDLIPIIVGACLAALVVIVLVAYLIGRARARRGGYQSV